ncbi:cytochrome c-type biogenesis protein CcmH [Alphaproteobacteria bacterium]|nr:cytochrome c-type biogenesis protein CcmH [Alphaproteobacteria bacterium]
MLLIKQTLFLLFLSLSFFGLTKSNEIEQMRKLAAELRCVVCQNQSLLESDSQIAKDLKELILDMYINGKSDSEIKLFLVDRYGEFILFKPTFNSSNILLWLAPLLSFLIISFLAFRKLSIFRRKK